MQPCTEHLQPRRGMALHNHSIRHWQELPTSNGCAKLWNQESTSLRLWRWTFRGRNWSWDCLNLPTSLSSYAKFPYIGFSMFLLVLSNLDSGQANGRIRTKNPVRLKEAGQLWVPKNEPQGHPKIILVARKQQQYQTSKQMPVTWGCFQPMSSRSFGEWCQQNIYWIRGSSLEAPGPCHMLFNLLP